MRHKCNCSSNMQGAHRLHHAIPSRNNAGRRAFLGTFLSTTGSRDLSANMAATNYELGRMESSHGKPVVQNLKIMPVIPLLHTLLDINLHFPAYRHDCQRFRFVQPQVHLSFLVTSLQFGKWLVWPHLHLLACWNATERRHCVISLAFCSQATERFQNCKEEVARRALVLLRHALRPLL